MIYECSWCSYWSSKIISSLLVRLLRNERTLGKSEYCTQVTAIFCLYKQRQQYHCRQLLNWPNHLTKQQTAFIHCYHRFCCCCHLTRCCVCLSSSLPSIDGISIHCTIAILSNDIYVIYAILQHLVSFPATTRPKVNEQNRLVFLIR